MANIEMIEYKDGTNFLKKHMFKQEYTNDKRQMKITWNCWPQEVPYEYSYHSEKKEGYYTGGTASYPGGILRKENDYKRTVRRGIFEGLKTHEIKYRKNGGTWTTINPKKYDEHIRTFISKKNGDKYEIKVTYYLCTMGFPHRWFPFMWFNGEDRSPSSSYFHQYRFTSTKVYSYLDQKPCYPGFKYAKVPDSWNNEVSYTWNEPETGKSWSKEYGSDTTQKQSEWRSKFCCEVNISPKKWEEGWVSEANNSPQAGRRSSYFIFKRTFTDSFITSGILERPAEIPDPDKPVVECISAHGERGKVNVTYNHKNGEDGQITLYGLQYNNNKKVTVVKDIDVLCGDTIQIDVDFIKCGFDRSKEIAYYATARVYDAEYNTYRTSSSIDNTDVSTNWNNFAKGHYFNDEPPAVDPKLVDSLDTTKTARINFSHVKDPDSDSVSYITYIARQNSELNTNSKMFYGGTVKGIKGVNGTVNYYMEMDAVNTPYIDIDMSSYEDREKITVWIESTDNYDNSYYWSSVPVTIIKTKSPSVSIKVTPSHGESGKLSVTYRHDKGTGGNVELMAYQSESPYGIKGSYLTSPYTFTVASSGSTDIPIEITKEFTIDFTKSSYGFTRSRHIKYFAVATDEDKKKSSIQSPDWIDDCVGGHYFNEEPPPVTPYISREDLLTSTEVAYLEWPKSIDPDNDDSTYEVFISNPSTDNEQEYFFIRGENKLLNYTNKISTKETKYSFDVRNYDNSKLKVWIRTKDGYENSYYYTGNILEFSNKGLAPYTPIVTTVPAHEESGDLYINYGHPTGRSGKIYLYAIAKYKDGRTILINVFEKLNITNDNYVILSNGSNQSYTIDFTKLLGPSHNDRSCEIRYYAVAYTVGFEDNCSEGENWTPSINMYDKWVTGHYYNEEPPEVNIRRGEDTDLHHNIKLEWDESIDPDGDITTYYVYLDAKSNTKKKEDKFFVQSGEDKYLTYTHEYITKNNKLDIDLDDFPADEEFKIWIKTSDGYPNSYYYSSNILNFQKLSYHPPKIEASIDNVHGENGKLTIKYIHPDYGQIDRNGFDGKVSVYAYVDDVYRKTILEDIPFIHNEIKEFNINFKDITLDRSCYISYFIVATDNDPGLSSSDTNSRFASAIERIGASIDDDNRHYFNEEPSRVIINTGQPDRDEDRPYYMFDYINVVWEESYDSDDDPVYYDLYIKTINNNDLLETGVFDFSDERKEMTYNKRYRMYYDVNTDEYVTLKYNMVTKKYNEIKRTDSLIFKIDYTDSLENWLEPEAWKGKTGKLWIVTTDGYENSYYRCSNIYEFNRQKHEPPNAVKLQCITSHGENGDLSVTYTHPENLNGIVTVYGYQEGKLVEDVATIEMQDGKTEVITIDFRNHFDRSTNISYFAIAKDSLSALGLISDNRNPKDIALIEHATGHYFNDEPAATNVRLCEDHTPFETVKIEWDLVDDPDGDDVTYYIYIACSIPSLNKNEEEFFGNGHDNKLPEGYENPESIGRLNYYKVYSITPQMEADKEYHKGYEIDISQFGEDERLQIWIQTRDEYKNSYYWSGDILTFDRGHSAYPILQAYPRTNCIVYSKTPRILIELNKDTFPQEVQVKWGNKWYSNKTDSEFFSSEPYITKYETIEDDEGVFSSIQIPHCVVFRPPIPYTTKHNSKVPYSIRVNNTCSTSEESYYTYIYYDFFNDFSDTKFIPLKSNHINTFKIAVNNVRDAYGLLTVNYNRNIIKNMILDNEDYNSVDEALKDVNDKINKADTTDRLDDDRTYIKYEDGQLVGYDSDTDTDFTEWQVLLDLLKNM